MWHKPCRTFNPWCLCIKTRCLLAFVRGIHRWSVKHKNPVTRKKFPFHDVIKLFYCQLVLPVVPLIMDSVFSQKKLAWLVIIGGVNTISIKSTLKSYSYSSKIHDILYTNISSETDIRVCMSANGPSSNPMNTLWVVSVYMQYPGIQGRKCGQGWTYYIAMTS